MQNAETGIRDDWITGRYWQTLEDGRVRCELCPRFCTLRDGQRGLCFIRANEGGEIKLTSYGRSSGFCIDPIEKKRNYPGTPLLTARG